MKNKILNVIIIVFSLTFISCTETKLGNWSNADKNSFWSEMEAIEELNNFGEKKSDFLNCYLNKLESNYSSFFSANNDEEGCSKFGIECGEEIFSNGSFLGNWSDTDKNKFWSDMESVDELNALGEDKSDFIECYLNKCESNYPSYYLADTDEEGCEKLVLECYDELF